MQPYRPPAYQIHAFNCPLCAAYAKQDWKQISISMPHPSSPHAMQTVLVSEVRLAYCAHCNQFSVWLNGAMVHPDVANAPLANSDLPDEVKADYEESRQILARSPRGAAALLRLAVQKFCKHLGGKGTNLNEDIAELVKKGLPELLQQSLDAVRVIGNNAVHPGQIDINDNPDSAARLFELVNLVCDYMVTQPKRVKEIYAKLPPAQKDAIKARDAD